MRDRKRSIRTPGKESIRNIYFRRGCQKESDKYKGLPGQQNIFTETKLESEVASIDGESMVQSSPQRIEGHGNGFDTQNDEVKNTSIPFNIFPFRSDNDEEVSSESDFGQLLLDTETSVKMMAEKKAELSESELLDLQDKIEYLTQTSKSLESNLYHEEKLFSVQKVIKYGLMCFGFP